MRDGHGHCLEGTLMRYNASCQEQLVLGDRVTLQRHAANKVFGHRDGRLITFAVSLACLTVLLLSFGEHCHTQSRFQERCPHGLAMLGVSLDQRCKGRLQGVQVQFCFRIVGCGLSGSAGFLFGSSLILFVLSGHHELFLLEFPPNSRDIISFDRHFVVIHVGTNRGVLQSGHITSGSPF